MHDGFLHSIVLTAAALAATAATTATATAGARAGGFAAALGAGVLILGANDDGDADMVALDIMFLPETGGGFDGAVGFDEARAALSTGARETRNNSS